MGITKSILTILQHPARHSSGIETVVDALQLFLDVGMPPNQFAEHTRASYGRDLRLLTDYLTASGISRVKDVGLAELRRYQAEMARRAYKPATQERKVYAIKAFFSFLYQQGVMPTDVAATLIPPSVIKQTPYSLTPAEFQRLLGAAQSSPRDTAMIHLMQVGLSVGQLTRLRLTDIQVSSGAAFGTDPEHAGVIQVRGRGKRIERLRLNDTVFGALQQWLAVRPPAEHDGVFVTRRRTPMERRAIGYMVAKYAKQAGIAHASPESLRHTTAASDVPERAA